ncbi:GNAT family N-acetyltransferase [Streptomyces sp. NPDC093225]|uniref:GNAT family N-acetyltransferase n=1 Tax=Streptomyces sp. NPDC093225 TaxID=3366034 RepID=UPI003816E3DF
MDKDLEPHPKLELLTAEHGPAVLEFERANRAYFAASVPDRGDAYFAEFEERQRGLLAEQAAGVCLFHVLVDGGGQVLGRVNLVDVEHGEAELGYRIAREATGQGLATAAVREVLRRARTEYGLRRVRARTTLDNAGSRAVLARTGFAETAELEVGGRPGLAFVRDLGPAAAE